MIENSECILKQGKFLGYTYFQELDKMYEFFELFCFSSLFEDLVEVFLQTP